MNKFEVRFLTRDEMANARDMDFRYAGVDEDNLGFADPLKNRVFVLASKDKEFQKYLLDHEIEHLFEPDGTHEDEYGIRHKKGLKFFKDIIAPFSTNPGNIFGGSKGPVANFSQAAFPIAAGAANPLLGAAASGAEAFGKSNNQQNQGGGYQNQGQGQGQGGNFNTMFNPQASFGQGFGQAGSPSPSGMGGAGQSGMGLAQPGISPGQGGLPSNAGISMGNMGGDQQQMQQRQQGYWNPFMRF